jgi:hypothetical protein
MTGQPTESRFVVRKDAWGKLMIWDRNIRRPAELERGRAVGLSEEQARQIIEQLRKATPRNSRLPPRLGRAGALFRVGAAPQSARELLTHQRARLLLEPPVGHGDSRLGQRVPKLWGASILD